MQLKLHTHRRHINEECTRVFLVLLNITFLIIFCVKNKKYDISDFGEGNIHNVLRNFLLCVFRILFNNDPQQI